MVSIICENCGKSFQAKYSAEVHKLTCFEKTANLFTCECGKKLGKKASFYAHKRVCQVFQDSAKPKNIDVLQYECQENDCVFKTKIKKEFLKHLIDFHNINIVKKQEGFNCYSEFEAWKDNEEKETDAQFVTQGTWNTSKGIIHIYACNRSGKYVPRTECRKRNPKSKGSGKLGFKCTSSMKVLTSNSSGAVDITYYGHYGHKHEIEYLRISAHDRNIIASELAGDVKHQQILNNLYAKDFNTKLERKHIITKQDIDNISRQYGLKKVGKHSKDHNSVDIYVQENIKDVLLYKRQFEEEFEYPKIPAWPLDKNDFVLCMMTAFQRKMLRKFGGDIICCEATHCKNAYDFKLITVLVVDEFREGVPVAWMISNRETAVALRVFFKAVKDNLGAAVLTPIIFMSDKSPQYYNSFQEVFACNAKKLLCHWHVLKDFNTNVCSKVKKDKQDEVYKSLCALLEEPSVEVFKSLLDEFLDNLKMSTDTQEFLVYFEREWLEIQEEWANCFRIEAGIDTNMFVEALHKKLKLGQSYLNGKKGTRVDKCFSVLFDFSRDVIRNRIIKLEKEKTTREITGITEDSCSSPDDCAPDYPASPSERNITSNLQKNIKAKTMEILLLVDSCTDQQNLILANNRLNNVLSILRRKTTTPQASFNRKDNYS